MRAVDIIAVDRFMEVIAVLFNVKMGTVVSAGVIPITGRGEE